MTETTYPLLNKTLRCLGDALQSGRHESGLFYGSGAINYHLPAENTVKPVDIDLAVEPEFVDALIQAADSLGFEKRQHPLLPLFRILRCGENTIEIHDFQDLGADFFCFRDPSNGCTWHDLIRYSEHHKKLAGIYVPSISLLTLMYIKYFDDWTYIKDKTIEESEVNAHLDDKWPSLIHYNSILFKECSQYYEDGFSFAIDIFNKSKNLGIAASFGSLRRLVVLLAELARLNSDQPHYIEFLSELKSISDAFVPETKITYSGNRILVHNPQTGKTVSAGSELSSQITPPYIANIQITARCNLACRHCAFPRSSNIITISTLRRILDRLTGWGVVEVGLGEGGEATIHPELPKLIEICSSEFDFTTNLTSNLATEWSDKLLSCAQKHLASVHSSFDIIHFEGRDYAQVFFDNLAKIYRETSCYIGVNISYEPGRIAESEMALKHLINMAGDRIHQVTLLKVLSPGRLDKLTMAEINKITDMFARITDVNLRVGFQKCDADAVKAYQLLGSPDMQDKPMASCPAGDQYVYIDCDGRLSPCGIRSDNDIADISEDWLSLLSSFVANKCHGCAYGCAAPVPITDRPQVAGSKDSACRHSYPISHLK